MLSSFTIAAVKACDRSSANTMLLLGPFPPPYGGVAIHLVRLLDVLRTRHVTCTALSIGGGNTAGHPVRAVPLAHVPFSTLSSRSGLHYHTDDGNWKTFLILALWWRLVRCPYMVTFHSTRHRPAFDRGLVRRLLRYALRGARHVVAIADGGRTDLLAWGCPPERCAVISSALPISSEERSLPASRRVPAGWLAAPLRVVANAGMLRRYRGEDLYGLDVLAAAWQRLDSTTRSGSGLLLVVGGIEDTALLAELERIASTTTGIWIITDHDGPLLPTVRQAHVVVRPTRTEGGPSLTLTEAIELGCIAVGSDAVPRPAGCRTFRNGDADDLARTLAAALGDARQGRMPPVPSADTTAVDALLALYGACGFVNTEKTPADV